VKMGQGDEAMAIWTEAIELARSINHQNAIEYIEGRMQPRDPIE
jgi:hypothetical protein